MYTSRYYRYTFPEHVQRTSSFLKRNTTFWLGLRGEHFAAIEAARDVVLRGHYRDVQGVLSARSTPGGLAKSAIRTFAGLEAGSYALTIDSPAACTVRSATLQINLAAVSTHVLVDRDVKSCVLFDRNGTEHVTCTVSYQAGAIVDVTVTASALCLQEVVVVLSAEPSVRAIAWAAPTRDISAGSRFVLPIAPPCVSCMVHFGDQVFPVDAGVQVRRWWYHALQLDPIFCG